MILLHIKKDFFIYILKNITSDINVMFKELRNARGNNNKLLRVFFSFWGQKFFNFMVYKYTYIYVIVSAAQSSPVLAYITGNQYNWVYDDSGTGARVDFSIWRPKLVSGYYALGDVAKTGHSAVI